jgi:hypothetical protein
MEEFRLIEFQHTRDFSRKLNATIEFIRQNIKPLTKSLLYIAGPSVLVGSVMAVLFVGEFFSLNPFAQADPNTLTESFSSASFWLQMLLMVVFILISFVVSVAVINTYMVLYDEKKSNLIEVSEVWERVQKIFWSYLGATIIFTFLFLVVYISMLIPVILVARVSAVLIFFGILFVIGVLAFLTVSASLTFFIQSYENKSFTNAVVRSYRLVNKSGKWWSTFGLIMVLNIIAAIISYIFLIPYYAVSFVTTFHNISETSSVAPSQGFVVITVVFFSIYYMLQMILYALPNVGIAFQYFNLVELLEAKGLMNRIDSIGKEAEEPQRPEEQY